VRLAGHRELCLLSVVAHNERNDTSTGRDMIDRRTATLVAVVAVSEVSGYEYTGRYDDILVVHK